jgi:hypothetical protein
VPPGIAFEQLDLTRKKILLVLAILVTSDLAAALFLYDTTSDESINARTATTNVEVMLATGAAAGLGLLVAIRQGVQGLHGRTYAALAIGLVMWTAGEICWVYDEVFLQNELPTDGLADIFWISGYPFLGYHLFRNYLYFSGSINRSLVIVSGIGTALAMAYVTFATSTVAQVSSSEDLVSSIFRISYAVGDCIIIFPAFLLVVTLRKAKLHFSPWFFISIGLMFTALADVIFAFVSVLGLADSEWMANLLYDAANLTIAGGLYWHYKHIVAFGLRVGSHKTTAGPQYTEDKNQLTDSDAQ